jgi:hypothetical protein
MAYLVLKDERAYADEWDDAEKFYEFDPSDKTAVERLHRILSLRKNGIMQNSENILASICEKSITPAPSVKVKTFPQRLLGQLKKFLRSSGNSKKKILRKQLPAVPVYSCNCFSAPQSSLQ